MNRASRHVTPDGRFALIHDPADDDVIGFEGYPWHTHLELLPGLDAEPEIQTMSQLIEALTERRLVLAAARTSGEIDDVWFTDDPESEVEGWEAPRTIELRYWDGQPYHAV